MTGDCQQTELSNIFLFGEPLLAPVRLDPIKLLLHVPPGFFCILPTLISTLYSCSQTLRWPSTPDVHKMFKLAPKLLQPLFCDLVILKVAQDCQAVPSNTVHRAVLSLIQ